MKGGKYVRIIVKECPYKNVEYEVVKFPSGERKKYSSGFYTKFSEIFEKYNDRIIVIPSPGCAAIWYVIDLTIEEAKEFFEVEE